MSMRCAIGLVLPALGAAHAPVFDHGTSTAPLYLGDATADSWAICIDTSRQVAAYYTFRATEARGGADGDFWMGLYTPGCARGNQLSRCADATASFTVAVWGLAASHCAPWTGWGETPLRPQQNVTGAAPGGPDLASATVFVSARAERVEEPVYEPFTPTVFTPRGSCVAQYPASAANLTLGVWSANGTGGHACVGLGRAERTVYSATNVLLPSRWRWQMYRWGRWGIVDLMWPVVCLPPLLHRLGAWLGRPAPERWLALVVSAQVLTELILVNWALRTASPSGASGLIAPVLRVILPLCAIAALSESANLRVSVAALCMLALLNMAFVVGPVAVLGLRLRRERKL